MPARPSFVVIVLDTVRADRLSGYGYGRPTTPRLDALAARGIRFANASSTSSWTVPAHASLFTGRYALDHGATQEHPRLDPGLPTLAEILAGYGWAAVGVSANPLVSALTGLERGFETFANPTQADASRGEHPNLVAVRRSLERLPPERPFFLFVNFIEAHHPYAPPEPERSRFLRRSPDDALLASAIARTPEEFYADPGAVSPEELAVLSDLYDGEIAALDGQVGALLDELERGGRLRDAFVIVTSDHGEAFGEHGHVRHVFSLHRTLVHVPLVVVPPHGERAGEVRSDPVSLLDVFATVLARARIPLHAELPGRDLLGEPPAERVVFAEYYHPLQALANLATGTLEAHPEVFARFRRRLRSVESGGLRLVASSRGGDELFDLARDPGERENLAGDPRWAQSEVRLRGSLDAFVAGARRRLPPEPGVDAPLPQRSFGDVDAHTLRRLRELGYVRP